MKMKKKTDCIIIMKSGLRLTYYFCRYTLGLNVDPKFFLHFLRFIIFSFVTNLRKAHKYICVHKLIYYNVERILELYFTKCCKKCISDRVYMKKKDANICRRIMKSSIQEKTEILVLERTENNQRTSSRQEKKQ